MKKILITGGLWYIGSHAVVAFEEAWYETIIVDNLDNSCLSTYRRIWKLLWKKPKFYEVDIRDFNWLDKIFSEHKIDWVIHFAWLKAVWESCEMPLLYFDNNIIWSIKLFEVMQKHSVKNLIFSSSATVYNLDNPLPYTEWDPSWKTSNPYWTTKYIIERIMQDLSKFSSFNVINLRYFNPIWAHPSGLIWEAPDWIPNNIFPYIMKVISWELEKISIFGNDYDTVDWTWVRDYIDINDLINGHIKAYDRLKNLEKIWVYEDYNLWVWKWVSVLELIKACENVIWKKIPYVFTDRRGWDLAIFYCNPEKANRVLSWKASTSIEDSVRNSLKFNDFIINEEKN